MAETLTKKVGEETYEGKDYHLKNDCPSCKHMLILASKLDSNDAVTGHPRMHRGF